MAQKKYTDYLDRVQGLIKDKSLQLDGKDTGAAISSAVSLYSGYVPRKGVKEYSSTGVRLYDLPVDWVPELSESYNVEFPIDDALEQPSFLIALQTAIYYTPPAVDGDEPIAKLRFTATNASDPVPATGEKFRLHYPRLHLLSVKGDVNTIPDSHFEAVCKLGARELCLILSSRLAQQASGVAGSDAADYRDKSDKMQKLAETFYQDFKDFIVPRPEATKAAGSFGRFREDAQNRSYTPTFPRDESGKLIV